MADANRKRRVLVVDDEPDVRTFLTTLLQDNGYETSVAGNGAEALQAIRAGRPDLVTLDITMPEQSGVRAYREIKTDPSLKGLPVVIVTGVSDDFKTFISTRSQVPPPDGFLTKPIDKTALLELVRKLAG
ncbi:MAG: response regulator [Deltaproteobacteria bacterium]|nr:response regulator [Deltaproteobacteria bacterium]